MDPVRTDLRSAMGEVSASSAGGSPFLIAYGATFFITGLLSLILDERITAMVAMFQGAVALPAAFFLERRMSSRRMSADNPLRSLSVLLAVSQALALPALIMAFSLNPRSVPLVLASLGGVHFLPYSWLHRSRVYTYLAAAVSLGAFAIQILLTTVAFTAILLFVGLVYWVAAPFVYRRAAELVREDSAMIAGNPL
jgi:hypothetical protein